MGALRRFGRAAWLARWQLRRWSEALRLRAVGEGHRLPFWVVSCARNPGEAAERCLNSVHSQDYDRTRITHLFIDDASTDGSVERIDRWMAQHPGHGVRFTRRPNRRGGTANNMDGFLMAPAGSIVVELNGDDWLPDAGVFRFLNRVYADPDVWMTYNTFRFAGHRFPVRSHRIPREVAVSNAFRDYPLWACQPLHSFRKELLDHLPVDTFLDPETGLPWESADDQALYFALLELAGSHARHLNRVTYVYNYREVSEDVLNLEGSRERSARIRRLERLHPLRELVFESSEQNEPLKGGHRERVEK